MALGAASYLTRTSAVPAARSGGRFDVVDRAAGQATSSKIGMIKIFDLRSRAQTALGDRFDIRAFHDVVRGGGALPLSIPERRVAD